MSGPSAWCFIFTLTAIAALAQSSRLHVEF